MIRSFFSELVWIIKSKVTIDLIRTYMMVTNIIFTSSFNKTECSFYIRLKKWLWICNAVIIMRFRRIMHYCIMPRNNFIKQSSITDIAMNKLDLVTEQRTNIL